jgi:hypothetical protein
MTKKKLKTADYQCTMTKPTLKLRLFLSDSVTPYQHTKCSLRVQKIRDIKMVVILVRIKLC